MSLLFRRRFLPDCMFDAHCFTIRLSLHRRRPFACKNFRATQWAGISPSNPSVSSLQLSGPSIIASSAFHLSSQAKHKNPLDHKAWQNNLSPPPEWKPLLSWGARRRCLAVLRQHMLSVTVLKAASKSRSLSCETHLLKFPDNLTDSKLSVTSLGGWGICTNGKPQMAMHLWHIYLWM